MKWEKYNQLTAEQKEEYNFRFGGIKKLEQMIPLIFTCFVCCWIFITIILIKDIKDSVETVKIGLWSLLLMFIFMFIYSIYIIWNGLKERRWIKERTKDYGTTITI